MPAKSVAIASEMPHIRRNHRRAKRPFDGRTAQGKRVAELVEAFSAKLGASAGDVVVSAAISKDARLCALSEDAQAKALMADPRITIDEVVRLARAADLAVRRLHLDRLKQTEGPTLAEVLREHAGRGREDVR